MLCAVRTNADCRFTGTYVPSLLCFPPWKEGSRRAGCAPTDVYVPGLNDNPVYARTLQFLPYSTSYHRLSFCMRYMCTVLLLLREGKLSFCRVRRRQAGFSAISRLATRLTCLLNVNRSVLCCAALCCLFLYTRGKKTARECALYNRLESGI